MTEIIIISVAVLVCQMAILRLWLSSELTYPIVNYLLKKKSQTTRKNPLWYLYSVLTCWQCLGVWVSLALTFYFTWIHMGWHNLGIAPALICLSLGISLVSEYCNYKFLSELPVYSAEDYDAESLSNGVESTPEVDEKVTEEVVPEGDDVQEAEAESNGNDDMGHHAW